MCSFRQFWSYHRAKRNQACSTYSFHFKVFLRLGALLVYTLESISVYFHAITFKYFIQSEGVGETQLFHFGNVRKVKLSMSTP